jgi:hypothetical protein
MDPVTLLSAARTTATLCLDLYRFYRHVQDAPKKSGELCDEVDELSSVMKELANTVKVVGESSDDVVLTNVISDDSFQKYSRFLNEISCRILVNKNDIKKKLKWPLSAKENEELIAKIERHKATFTLALQSAILNVGSAHTYFY